MKIKQLFIDSEEVSHRSSSCGFGQAVNIRGEVEFVFFVPSVISKDLEYLYGLVGSIHTFSSLINNDKAESSPLFVVSVDGVYICTVQEEKRYCVKITTRTATQTDRVICGNEPIDSILLGPGMKFEQLEVKEIERTIVLRRVIDA